jgi:hypothetical protein
MALNIDADRIALRTIDVESVPADLVGGAYVQLPIRVGGCYLGRGVHLSRDEVLGMRNWDALQRSRNIRVYPRSPVTSVGQRHIVHLGRGQYDVIEGRKLNAAPVSKEEAEELATRPN